MAATEKPVVRTGPPPLKRRRGNQGSFNRLSRGDQIAVGLMVGVPTLLVLWLVWLPAIASVALSFASWQGIGGIGTHQVDRPGQLQERLHELPAVPPGHRAQR